MAVDGLKIWHEFMQKGDVALLHDIIHTDAVFISPVVHTPQKGKAITIAYLSAAGHVLGNDSFTYVREFDCGERAVLEFVCTVDDIEINGVDMIEFDEAGLITEFKVMVRPLKAMQKVHQKMGEMLAKMAG